MPKKRHQNNYSKPPSTPPPCLASSSKAASHDGDATPKGVNELLAGLRRGRGSSNGTGSNAHAAAVDAALNPLPSVPPALRQVLRIPEAPTPQPRPRRADPRGRRLPPGPPAPRSWLSQSRHAPQARRGQQYESAGHDANSFDFVPRQLPGANTPDRGSLLDLAMSNFAVDWEFQRDYNRYWLYALPDHLKSALVYYLGRYRPHGASVVDLKRILLPPKDDMESSYETLGTADHVPNEGIHCLDLSGSLGKSMALKELSEFLFPRRQVEAAREALQESWDAPAIQIAAPSISILPNLSRLSLAVSPSVSHRMSWKHLLSFSAHLHSITHLSLAYWPKPTLTPNAVASVINSPTGSIQYGGTGFYSHSLDDDWTEAVILLRRLSNNLYGLEYLDISGCFTWSEGLLRSVDHDSVDWKGSWGKITNLVMHWGFQTPTAEDEPEQHSRFLDNVALAARVERHIIAQRSGRGRLIEVYRDVVPGP